jgi:hypothetical protein
MKTKVIALISILLLVLSVPAFAQESSGVWEIGGDAHLFQEMKDYGFQGGSAILDENDNTVGGEMWQESGKRMEGNADSNAYIDCDDCEDTDIMGGATFQSAGGSQSQLDGQTQVGVFGHADINLDKYRTVKTTKSGAFTFEKKDVKDVLVTKNTTEYEEEHEKEITIVDVDKASTDQGQFDLLVQKDFDVNADGKLDHTLSASADPGPPETASESDTWSAEGNLNVEKDLHVAGSGSSSSTDNFDLYKEEIEDETEYKEETFDHTVKKTETLNLSGTYSENCDVETHSGKTIAWNGNGVMGAQVQAGHQSGYVHSTTVAGSIDFNFDPVVKGD